MIRFFKYLISSSNRVSSKRVAGLFGIVASLVLIICGVQHPSIDTLLIGSFALLGATVIRREPDPYQTPDV